MTDLEGRPQRGGDRDMRGRDGAREGVGCCP